MNVGQKVRVVIADDTALYRKILSMAVDKIPSALLVGSAGDGIAALDVLKRQSADLVLLDVCMPRLDGIGALKEIHRLYPETAVVMFSGVTSADADTTVEALEIGALEFIPKPKTQSLDESMNLLSQELTRIVRLLKIRKIHRRISTNTVPPKMKPTVGGGTGALGAPSAVGTVTPRGAVTLPTPSRIVRRTSAVRFDAHRSLVVIGVSTGGPNALNQLMALMPKQLGCPILVVQHMPPFFTASLASFLAKKTGMDVKEASEGEAIVDNRVYIAPGGKHTVLVKDRDRIGGYCLNMNEDPPVNSCRPAVDVLFNSVAKEFSGSILSIILTGMGEDGADGVATLKRSPNCHSIAQDENSCVVYGMPRAIVDRGLADEVLPLDQIAGRVSELILKRKVG